MAAKEQEPEPKVTMIWTPAPERTADFAALLRALFVRADSTGEQAGDIPSDS
jgi:hypothetical protein